MGAALDDGSFCDSEHIGCCLYRRNGPKTSAVKSCWNVCFTLDGNGTPLALVLAMLRRSSRIFLFLIGFPDRDRADSSHGCGGATSLEKGEFRGRRLL